MGVEAAIGSAMWMRQQDVGGYGRSPEPVLDPPEAIFPLAHSALPSLPLPTQLFPHPILSSLQTLC